MKIKSADRARRAKAKSLEDIGAEVIRWLEGNVAGLPRYSSSVDVDERDAPGMTHALIRLNRMGFVTDNSQAAIDRLGSGSQSRNHWVQRAAVTGFAQQILLEKLRYRLPRQFEILGCTSNGMGWGEFDCHGYVVTTVNGEPYTNFGRHSSCRDLESDFRGYGAEAIEAVCAAWQVTIVDTKRGSNELWQELLELDLS